MWVLIVMTIGVSQSYQRANDYYPQVSMQRFDTQAACENAGKAVMQMYDKRVGYRCVPYSIR